MLDRNPQPQRENAEKVKRISTAHFPHQNTPVIPDKSKQKPPPCCRVFYWGIPKRKVKKNQD
jgi:hypothetical protein